MILIFVIVSVTIGAGGCILGCFMIDKLLERFYPQKICDRASPAIMAVVIVVTLVYICLFLSGLMVKGTAMEVLLKISSMFAATFAGIGASIFFGSTKYEPVNYGKLIVVSLLTTVIFLLFTLPIFIFALLA